MAYSVQDLKDRLGKFSRLDLADLPTPLDRCPRLSGELGGPMVWVKREDQTGLAMGGNKAREFEYSVAPAVDEDYDVFVVVVRGVHLASEKDLFVIVNAVRLLGLGLGPGQRRQQQRSQDRNDRDNHQQFN